MEIDGKITEIIQNIFCDIKAEAVIADLMENGLKADGFISINKGIFKRRYSHDIDSLEKIKLENGKELLAICLNRDGFYDSLPEGLFHTRSEKAVNETNSSSKESKKLKREEKATRNFFLPFENEITLQRVQLELEERKILSRFSENLFDDIYPALWDLHKSLHRKYVYKMVLLLHLAHKIAGNVKLTAKCLETILDEKVEVKIVSNSSSKSLEIAKKCNDEKKCLLGKGELGVSFMCGDNFDSYNKIMEFNIGPLKNTYVTEYLEDGAIAKFLDCFYGYFVPVDLEVTSNIVVGQAEQSFELTEEFGGPVLGFETSI